MRAMGWAMRDSEIITFRICDFFSGKSLIFSAICDSVVINKNILHI